MIVDVHTCNVRENCMKELSAPAVYSGLSFFPQCFQKKMILVQITSNNLCGKSFI